MLAIYPDQTNFEFNDSRETANSITVKPQIDIGFDEAEFREMSQFAKITTDQDRKCDEPFYTIFNNQSFVDTCHDES